MTLFAYMYVQYVFSHSNFNLLRYLCVVFKVPNTDLSSPEEKYTRPYPNIIISLILP